MGRRGAASLHNVSTQVPSPARERRKPSAVSCSNAETTVIRETPSSLTSVRVDGRRVPLGSKPARICVRNCSYSCRCKD